MKDAILWTVLALVWGSSYLAIKLGIESFSPLALVALRMLIGTSILLIVLYFRSQALPGDIRSWSILLVSGLIGNIVPFTLIGFGELHVESGIAALLMGIAPVVTVLLAPLIHPDESLTIRSIIGIVIGLLGLVVLIGPDVAGGLGAHVLAEAAILGAALCYAFTTLFARRYANLPALVMAAGSMLVGTVVAVVASLVLEAPFHVSTPSAGAMMAALYLGLFPTALATLIYFHLVHRIGAARLSQINFVVPVAGAFMGMVFLNEALGANAHVALSLILVAVYFATGKKRASADSADPAPRRRYGRRR